VTGSGVRVLVLYSHSLLGEGMSRMLAEDPGLDVTAVDVACVGARDAALDADPDVIVLEEGSTLDAADLLRRTHCRVVVDVDISSAEASTLRRATIRSRPDDVMAAIRQAVGPGLQAGRHGAASRKPALPS
jgi:chemotaxis response regulator CheB